MALDPPERLASAVPLAPWAPEAPLDPRALTDQPETLAQTDSQDLRAWQDLLEATVDADPRAMRAPTENAEQLVQRAPADLMDQEDRPA